MNDDRIRRIVVELDELVPRSGAIIRPGEFFTETDEPAMTGNRAGYLRLGVELLKIADLPSLPDRPERVAADIGYLIDPNDSTGVAATFERRDNLRLSGQEEADRPKGWGDRLVVPFFALFGIVLLLALVLGFIQIAHFLFR